MLLLYSGRAQALPELWHQMVPIANTLVSQASTHCRVSAHVTVLAVRMESAHALLGKHTGNVSQDNLSSAHQYLIQEYNVKIFSFQSLTLYYRILQV